MSCYDNMLFLLEPLGLYRLTGDTLVDKELLAYEAGFSLLEAQMDTLLREAFVPTAEEEGLSLRESLYGVNLKGISGIEDRREMLTFRLSAMPSAFNKAGIVQALASVGIVGTLDEAFDADGDCTMDLQVDNYLGPYTPANQLLKLIMTILPAHLAVNCVFAISNWAFYNHYDYTFTQWNNADYTCKQLEELTQES